MLFKNYKIKKFNIYDLVDSKIINKLQKIIGKQRFLHSLSVAETSVLLANKFQVDIKKAALAGILHDCAKEMPLNKAKKYLKNLKVDILTKKTPAIWHALIGYIYAKKSFGVKNNEILNAIKYHTVGSTKMSKLAKIVYIADFIADRKKYISSKNTFKLLKIQDMSLNKLLLYVLKEKIFYLLENNKKIHINAIKLYNYITD